MSEHCWHATGRATLPNFERQCCYCGRIGMAPPPIHGQIAGHGPFFILAGAPMSGPYAEGYRDDTTCDREKGLWIYPPGDLADPSPFFRAIAELATDGCRDSIDRLIQQSLNRPRRA